MGGYYRTATVSGVIAGLVLLQPATGASAIAVDEAPVTLAPVVIVATKTPRPVAEVTATVTIVTAAELSERISLDMADVVRYEPAISVRRGDTRFGWGSYSIRGVGGNRVAIELDGVPVRDQFAIGSYASAGRDLVDPVLLRRVEVLYGPASALYGSDALGGVVAYETLRPSDLAQPGKPYLGLNNAYRGDAGAFSSALSGAWTGAQIGGLVTVSNRHGNERDASAISNGPSDWVDYDSLGSFTTLTWEPHPFHRLSAVVDTQRRDAQSSIRSLLGTGRFAATTLLEGDDEDDRLRTSLKYDYSGGTERSHDGRLIVYHQDSETRQYSVEERAGQDLRRERLFSFRQRSNGAEFNGNIEFAAGRVRHTFGYGLDIARIDTVESRDAWQTTLAGTERSNVVLGEVFPVRDFPNSQTTEIGLYLQDEISAGRWTLIPALRFDHYELQPDADALYREDHPDADIVQLRERNISPRLGFTVALTRGWSAFGQYARGFRAPPFEDANIGLDIPLFNIRALPNPELRSETSNGFEAGLRHITPGSQLSVATFYTRYKDFIESKARLGADPETGVLLFQSRNLERTTIRGAELRWQQDLSAVSGQLENFELAVAAAWTRGKDDVTGEDLQSIDPAQMVTSLRWNAPHRPWNLNIAWTLGAQKTRTTDAGNELARSGGYGVVDVTSRYDARQHVQLQLGLFNVFDKTYWHWSSVRGLAKNDPTLALMSEPGRYAGASLLLRW